MDILNDIYLIVDLCGDTLKKYKIICKMDFYNRVIDVRTGREIYINGMYDDDIIHEHVLCCENKFIPISKEKMNKLIANDDIDDYNDYLDEIVKKYSKVKRSRVRKR